MIYPDGSLVPTEIYIFTDGEWEKTEAYIYADGEWRINCADCEK